MTLEQNLQRLIDARNRIADAITSKGVVVSHSEKLDNMEGHIRDLFTDGDFVWTKTNVNSRPTVIELRNPGTYRIYASQTIYQDLKTIRMKPVATGVTSKYTIEIHNTSIEEIVGDGPFDGYYCKFSDCTNLKTFTGFGSLTNELYANTSMFKNCSSLEWEGPLNCTGFSSSAFEGCSSIHPSSIGTDQTTLYDTKAFKDCTSIDVEEIHCSSSCTLINDECFSGCTNLRLKSLPNSIATIDEKAFYNCESITLENGLPSNIERIYDYAFAGCLSLEDIVIPVQISDISQHAFEGSGVKHVVTGRDYIREYTFKDCKRLETFAIGELFSPYGQAYIQQESFMGCESLTTIDFTSNPQAPNIYPRAFKDCTSLTTILINGYAYGSASQGMYLMEYAFEGCTSLQSLSGLDDRLQYIEEGVFKDCTSLKGPIRLREDCTSGAWIDPYAFENCVSLDDLLLEGISNSYLDIYDDAFKNCTGLRSVTIHFPNCNSFKIEANAFRGCDGITFNVPWSEGEVENYPWGCTNASINYNYTPD